MDPTRAAPRATQAPQRPPKERQRAPQRGLGRGKIDPKAVAEAKKLNFVESAPRTAPADKRSTSELPRSPEITLESLQIGASTVSRGLLDRLRSPESDSGAL